MKTLSEFLEIEEGVAFKVEHLEDTFVIRNNKLFWSIDGDKLMGTVNTPLNNIVGRKITILPKKQILTDEEREYLKTVIKPFKDNINEIYRPCENVLEFYNINYDGGITTILSITFDKEFPFKSIQSQKTYTLDELGLEEEKC